MFNRDLNSEIVPPLPAPGQAARRFSAWLLLPIFILAAAAYANSVKNDFAFDDVTVVQNNPHVVELQWTAIWTDNYWASTDGLQSDILYRPLTLWTYLANQAITPGAAWAFHLTNVLLHALVCVLVTLLAWRLTASRVAAFLTGVLFAVHPLHTEAVANTVGRAELLAAVWCLLALLIYLPRSPLSGDGRPRRPWWHGWLVAVCFFAAILSKETPASFPLLILILDIWVWLRWNKTDRPGPWRWFGSQALRYYLPLAAVFAGYMLMRLFACGLMTPTNSIHPIVNLLTHASLAERIITPFALLARYLALIFWPARLCADYSAPSLLPTANPFEPYTAAGILLCLLAVIAAVRSWRKYPQVALFMSLFLASYLLVANILRIGTIFGERLFYWPSAFVVMFIAWLAVHVYRQLQGRPAAIYRRAGWSLAALLCVAMCIRTYIRNTDWESNIPLAVATARDNPESAKACYWAGDVLIYAADNPRFVDIGHTLLQRSIELYPDFAGPYWELAKDYGRQQNLGQSVIYLSHTARLDPGVHDTRVALTAIVQNLAVADPKIYMPDIEQFRKDHPDDELSSFALALAYHGQKKYDQAADYAKEALEESHNQFHEAAAEWGVILFDSGKKLEGMSRFRQYVTAVNRSVEARCTLAEMILSLDIKDYPQLLVEADYNIKRASALDAQNPRIRRVQALLNQKTAHPREPIYTVDAQGPAGLNPPIPEPAGGGK